MATSGTEYYNRLDLIVVRIGTVTSLKLFEKRAIDLKPPGNEDRETWTVDSFMELKRRQIMHLRPKNTIKFHLYPVLPKIRDHTQWDIITLVFVLTRVCDLDEALCSALNTFRDTRNYLDHLENPVMPFARYQKILNDLKKGLNLCSRALFDETFEAWLQTCLDELEHNPLSVSDMTKFYHQRAKEQHAIQSILTENSKDTKTLLRKVDKLLKRSDVDFTAATESQATETDDDVVQRFDVELKLLFSECNPERAKQILLESFQRRIPEVFAMHTLNTSAVDEAIGGVLEDLSNSGCKIVYADEGCVRLLIRHKSPRGLLNFFQDYLEGKLQKLFTPVKDALQMLSGFEKMTLDVVIYEDEFKRVMANTVTFLSKCLSGAEESNMNVKDSIMVEDDLQEQPSAQAQSFDLYRRSGENKKEHLPLPNLRSLPLPDLGSLLVQEQALNEPGFDDVEQTYDGDEDETELKAIVLH